MNRLDQSTDQPQVSAGKHTKQTSMFVSITSCEEEVADLSPVGTAFQNEDEKFSTTKKPNLRYEEAVAG